MFQEGEKMSDLKHVIYAIEHGLVKPNHGGDEPALKLDLIERMA
jgi:hypothetical protein